MTIDRFQIIVDVNFLERFSSGSLMGSIYCKLGDLPFPDNQWSDFVLIILSWWLEGASKLIAHSSNYEKFLFMDGSFEMHMRLKNKEVYEVTCIDGHENTETVFECSLEDIVKEVVSASKKIIAKCDKECWESPELDALCSSYDTLLTWNDNEKFR